MTYLASWQPGRCSNGAKPLNGEAPQPPDLQAAFSVGFSHSFKVIV